MNPCLLQVSSSFVTDLVELKVIGIIYANYKNEEGEFMFMKHKIGLLIVSSILVMALLFSTAPFRPFVRAETSPFFFDDFESHSVGVEPEGYYCEQSADGLAKTVVSDNFAKDGVKALLISDMSDNFDNGRALLSRQFTPVTSLTVEFDYYPVSANVNAIGVFYGGTASTNGMFSIYLYPDGEL